MKQLIRTGDPLGHMLSLDRSNHWTARLLRSSFELCCFKTYLTDIDWVGLSDSTERISPNLSPTAYTSSTVQVSFSPGESVSETKSIFLRWLTCSHWMLTWIFKSISLLLTCICRPCCPPMGSMWYTKPWPVWSIDWTWMEGPLRGCTTACSAHPLPSYGKSSMAAATAEAKTTHSSCQIHTPSDQPHRQRC